MAVQSQPSTSTSRSAPVINSSSSTSPSTTSIQPSPETTTTINALHYSFLFDNDIDGLLSTLDNDFDFSNLVVESDNNTILHIAASAGLVDVVNSIIERSPNLLIRPNYNGDLPIHVAAKACQFAAVVGLVSSDNSMLESVNNDNNTALHIALQNQQEKMANYLFEKGPKSTFYQLNVQGFSPLYLAIKAEFWDLVKVMLSDDSVTKTEVVQQLSATSAKSIVHAAVIAKNKEIFERIFQRYNDVVLYKKDEYGRTTLSYAAYTGFVYGVKCIINDNKSRNEAYIIDENGLFPIHWACRGGNVEVIKEFFSCLPKNTRFMLSNKGYNILHVAAEAGKTEVAKYILQQPELEVETMINMKDEEGNTPLHLASRGKHPMVVYDFTRDDRVKLTTQNKAGLTALDIAEDFGDRIPSFSERLTWLSLRNAGVPRAPQVHYLNINRVEPQGPQNSPSNVSQLVHNYNNSPTTYMVLNQQGNLVTNLPINKRKHKYKERINTLLLVATLVATVTFTSGFTVPGGYNNNKPNEGMATLAHKCAFQVFVISNTIAMYTAILTAVTLIWAQLDDLRLVLLSLDFALPLLGTSLAMMSVAFMAGFYVVLHSVALWLGIVVLVMGGLFLGAFLVFFIPLYSPRSCIRNKVLRNVFHVPFTLMLLACEKDKVAGSEGKEYNRNDFPKDFVFGVSTSAYQVEGAALEDGRKRSIYDTFAHRSKHETQNPDVGCDQYHKYKEDVKLMVETGLNAYRFSISWSRLIPNGRGPVNPKGLRYYNNLINELISHGIEPHVTLTHTDTPQVLEDEYGGFLDPRIIEDYTSYVDVCFREFGDRVRHWTTFNEANIFVIGGYDVGITPPSRCSSPFGIHCTGGNSTTEPYVVAHIILLAHAYAVRIYKEKYQAKQLGFIGMNLLCYHFSPLTNKSEDVIAAQRSYDFYIGWFMHPLTYGDYPEIVKKNAGSRIPVFSKTESKLVKGSFDFIGINYYTVMMIKDNSISLTKMPRDLFADMAVEWLMVPMEFVFPNEAWGLERVLEHFKEVYENPTIFIHENGQASNYNTSINDPFRVEYIHAHIGSLLNAVRETTQLLRI
ncbi:hypothetical protein SOVF_104960 isoform B [Spinacia oleracea]|nr:hypothetical protein SOVF_104960 isoform B [Spinacia oleracea]